MSNIQAFIENPLHIIDTIDGVSIGTPAYNTQGDWFVAMTDAGDYNFCKLNVSTAAVIVVRRPDQSTYTLSVPSGTVSFWGSRPRRP